MQKKRIVLITIFILAILLVYFRWSSAIRQPLEFSHAQHVKANIQCAKCHMTPDTVANAADCKACHTEMNFPARIAWIKVYRVAPDIIFSHAKHSKVPCATCHQEFTSADRWIHESRFKMSFCMDCHDDTGAPNACKTCHLNK